MRTRTESSSQKRDPEAREGALALQLLLEYQRPLPKWAGMLKTVG